MPRTPELLAEPVAQFGSVSVHINSQMNSNPANRRAVNFNTKVLDRLELDRCFQEFSCILACIRVWKFIAQREPNFAIIRMLDERLRVIQAPWANGAAPQNEMHRLLRIEFYTRLLDFAVRQEPDKRFVMKIDNLDAIAPGIVKITAEWRYQLDLVFASEFLTDFLELRFVADHDSEMTHVHPLRFFYFENREELMLAQFEKRVALAASHLLQIENVLVKRHCLLDIIYFDRDMITSIDLHAHTSD